MIVINGRNCGTTSQQWAAGVYWHLVPLPLLYIPCRVDSLPTIAALCPPEGRIEAYNVEEEAASHDLEEEDEVGGWGSKGSSNLGIPGRMWEPQ